MSESLKGHLLVASPKLKEKTFFRSVILLVQHDDRGSMGLILNKPLDVRISAAWKKLSQSPCEIEGNLHRGGPCEGVLMALHTDVEASDVEVLDGVHFSTTKDAIEHLVGQGAAAVRLFVGYAGWSPGQLESEIADGSWLSIPASHARVFDPREYRWESLFRTIGHDSLLQWMDPRLVPDDPSVN